MHICLRGQASNRVTYSPGVSAATCVVPSRTVSSIDEEGISAPCRAWRGLWLVWSGGPSLRNLPRIGVPAGVLGADILDAIANEHRLRIVEEPHHIEHSGHVINDLPENLHARLPGYCAVVTVQQRVKRRIHIPTAIESRVAILW